jgi:hypothetical protein
MVFQRVYTNNEEKSTENQPVFGASYKYISMSDRCANAIMLEGNQTPMRNNNEAEL